MEHRSTEGPWTTRTVTGVGGVALHVLDAGPADGPLVVLCHGFPELAWSWRHQIPALAAAGFRVLAHDARGYGRSDVPEAVEDYDIDHLTGDVVALIDDAGRDVAVVIGHDWGAHVAWSTALLHPARVHGVVGVSVPHLPRGRRPPTESMRHLFAGRFFYQLYFQEPGVADADLGADPAETMRRIMGAWGHRDDAPSGNMTADDGRGYVERMGPVPVLPPWISEDELAVYSQEFTRTGFTGGINWYRNLDRNWHLTEGRGTNITVPARYVYGTSDPTSALYPAERMAAFLDDDRGAVAVEAAAHWVQQERPSEVDAALLDFLGGLTHPW